MRILAIDPGTRQSAYVDFEDGKIIRKGIYPNEEFLKMIGGMFVCCDLAAIEFIQCYGMPVGKEVYETVWWSGKFGLACNLKGLEVKRIARPTVKSFVTGMGRAKDKDVRQALMMRFGGTKKGEPLHGVSKDIWAALAVAVYVDEISKVGKIEEWSLEAK